VYGDDRAANILQTENGQPTSFAQYADGNVWTVDDVNGQKQMSQSLQVDPGETYEVTFELASNIAGGSTAGAVEVLWNGQVIGTVETSSGVFETHSIEIPAGGSVADLTFREIDPSGADTGPVIDTSGPIATYAKDVTIDGQVTEVSAFAPGQAKLYQVIDGQLKVFDTASNTYADGGDGTGLALNAVGFNIEDDLIYGIAKASGTDALGNAVSPSDVVMLDATGNAYRVGDGHYADYVGDFDDSGNLWTFHASLDRVTKIDVDNLDANGDPVTETFHLPKGLFSGNIYDIAFNSDENAFYAIQSPGKNGQNGQVHKIDLAGVDEGGDPQISSIPITGTLLDGEMHGGMAKGAYGAVFLDGDGNLYYGMNKGDHDFDRSTGSQGAIYKVNADWDAGSAYAEFMAESQSTNRNDGAVDPRAADAFAEVDETATVLIRNPSVTVTEGGDDKLRGDAGEDEMYGGGGDDIMHGGADNDYLSGDQGDDKMYGGAGNDSMDGGQGADRMKGGAGDDTMDGGAGDDRMFGGAGNDRMAGGAGDDMMKGEAGDDSISGDAGSDRIYGGDGADRIDGGADDDTVVGGGGNDHVSGGAGADMVSGKSGNDELYGGAGSDKLIGGSGSDTIEGGAGTDHMWGGEWGGDSASDTFVVSGGSGKDFIHDFEVDHDVVDLSAYGLEFTDLAGIITDRGWATEIDLSGLQGGQYGDKLYLKSVDPDELDESNFIL
ncbi:MAG: calcium-binding protein, partial [Pseudomonadota bacterium]